MAFREIHLKQDIEVMNSDPDVALRKKAMDEMLERQILEMQKENKPHKHKTDVGQGREL